MALSAVYPMAFDEDFHFGLIKVYSHYWLPFLSSQPPHAAAYGAVARDPSYLFHYLMSFPYRLIALFIHGQTGQVIVLRLIDIGLFASGLVLFRRVLLRAKMSLALTNLSLLLFVLIPIVPQLAAHINYDDLIFPLVALTCLLTFNVTDQLRKKQPSARTIIELLAVCFFAGQVKYEFMPVFAGVVLFLLFVLYRNFRGQFGKFWPRLWQSWRLQSYLAKVLLVVALLVSFGLFVQRDGYNLVKYHTFTPDCSKVVSVQSCKAYGPWRRNYDKHQKVLASPTKINYFNPATYLGVWSYWMWYRMFFVVNGPASHYTNYPPLPLISAAAALIGIAGIIGLLIWRRRIFQNNPYIAFFAIVILLYLVALWIAGYAQYRYTNQLVLMNGRYLLPILLLACAIIGRAFSLSLRDSPNRKAAIAVVAILLFLQGGGFLSFISRSDSSWDWPNNTVVKVNNAARKITKPIIVKGSKYYSTHIWFFN